MTAEKLIKKLYGTNVYNISEEIACEAEMFAHWIGENYYQYSGNDIWTQVIKGRKCTTSELYQKYPKKKL